MSSSVKKKSLLIDWDNPITKSLVLCLLFNQGVGSVSDSSKYKLVSTMVNSPVWKNGNTGKEILFSKGSDQYIDLGNPSQLQITDNLSILLSYRLTTAPSVDNTSYQLVSKDKESGGRSWIFDIHKSGVGGVASSGVRIGINGGSGLDIIRESRFPLAGDDRQAGVSYRKVDKKLSLFINGKLTSEGTSTTNGIPSSTAKVLVGRREYSGFTEPMDGVIRYVYVWNRSLTKKEFFLLYKNPFIILKNNRK